MRASTLLTSWGGEELTTTLASPAGIHVHEVFVGIAEGIVVGLPCLLAEVHVLHGNKHTVEARVALGDAVAQEVAIDHKVGEKTTDVSLGGGADSRGLDGVEDAGEGLVEVVVVFGTLAHIAKQLAGEDEIAFLGHNLVFGGQGIVVGQLGIGEVGLASLMLETVDIVGNVLGDEAVEECAEDVGLEIPAVDSTTQLVGDSPDGFVQFGLFGCCCHGSCCYLLLSWVRSFATE